MAFVVKLTWGVAMEYDFTYEKNLKADRKYMLVATVNLRSLFTPEFLSLLREHFDYIT